MYDFTLVYSGRKFSILCPNIWFMAQSSKRKTKASGSFSSDSDICSPEGKKPCNSAQKVLDEEDQEKQPNMSEKITAQLEMICQMLTSVKSRLQNLENIFEHVSGLEKSISNFGTELSKLSNKTAGDVQTAKAFANTEFEALKKKELARENKIKELEDRLLYQEVYNRRKNLRFFGIREPTSGTKDVRQVVHKFLKEELELEITEDIEFQRAHHIGKKKTGETRPVIVRFLRFPEREMVFKRAREMQEETNAKVYADYLKEISERRKQQWPRMKKAREEGKTAIFLKSEPDKLFINGFFVPR